MPTAAGLNQLQMIDAARDGKLKALWAIGYDVFLSNANAHETAKAFANMDLVIIQDFFMNETAKRFGHVFFPATTSFEKDGTFMNGERRVQRIRKAVEPAWKFAFRSARSSAIWRRRWDMQKILHFSTAEEVWNEVRAVWPPGYGITYDRIEKAASNGRVRTLIIREPRYLHGRIVFERRDRRSDDGSNIGRRKKSSRTNFRSC